MSRTPHIEEILAFARRVYDAPYEVFSRFLLPSPRHLYGEEALQHIEQGWGLSCSEKTRLFAHFLSSHGIRNTVVGGAFEMWVDGVNLMKMKGNGRDPPREDRILRFFAPEWKMSPYESPLHMSHWANHFELDGEPHLIDTVGALAVFRNFRGADVTRLLDSDEKGFVDYLPSVRIYYHRFTEELLQLVDAKQRADAELMMGRFLGTSMLVTATTMVNVKWWWRERQFEEDLRKLPELTERSTGGEMSLTFLEHPAEVRARLEGTAPSSLLDGFERAWPEARNWIDRLFERPSHVRLVMTEARKPFVSYSSNQVRNG